MGLALFLNLMIVLPCLGVNIREKDIRVVNHPAHSRITLEFSEQVDIRVVDGMDARDPFFFVDVYGALADFDERVLRPRGNSLKAIQIQNFAGGKVLRLVFFSHRKTVFRVFDERSKSVYPISVLQEKAFVPSARKTDFLVIEVGATEATVLPALLSRKRRVILDPGHGGTDPGAVSRPGAKPQLEEKNLNLEIAKRVQSILGENPNIEVLLTRYKDTNVSLKRRLDFAEEIGSERDLFVAIHVNAAKYHTRNSDARGVEFYYLSRTSNPDTRGIAEAENREDETKMDPRLSRQWDLIMKQLIQEFLEEFQALGIQACEGFDRAFKKDAYYGKYNRGIKSAAFRVLMNRVMPAVLIEVGFIDHPVESRFLANNEFQDRLAQLIASGVLEYFSQQDSISP
jgi:N-acetylmuramoyl-L-alanine amidase